MSTETTNSSSDEEDASNWLPYSQRNEWSDVTPIEQDDGEHPIVAIAYSFKFREVFDYFRAILATNEKSKRALDLTTDALELNAGNYTVWQYRRDILLALNLNLYDELDYIKEVMNSNSKNYQVWHHRRTIVELLKDTSKELQLTEMVLNLDSKNYHAWQHRQWAIKWNNLYEDELTFVDRLIANDIRNNSAWNQRFFVLQHLGLTPEIIERELQYTMNRIRLVERNESAWNFLEGLIKNGKQATSHFDSYPEVREFCEELYNNGSRSPYLLSFLIEIYTEQCLSAAAVACADNSTLYARKVYALCDGMSKDYDVIRRKYWQHVANQLAQNLKLKNSEKCNDFETTTNVSQN